MSTTPKLFELRPEDIQYLASSERGRARAWVKLTKGPLPREASAEAGDVFSAVGKAIEVALEAWFDKGRISVMPNSSMIRIDDAWLCNAFVFGRLAAGCVTGACTERGEAQHYDQVIAAGLAYVAAINALITRYGVDSFIVPTPQPA